MDTVYKKPQGCGEREDDWYADIICSLLQVVSFNGLLDGRCRLLLDISSFALGFGSFGRAGGCKLTSLHELANVSVLD